MAEEIGVTDGCVVTFSKGLPLPQEIVIFAIEASDVSTFSEKCTPEVTRAIPTCVEMVLRELKRW